MPECCAYVSAGVKWAGGRQCVCVSMTVCAGILWAPGLQCLFAPIGYPHESLSHKSAPLAGSRSIIFHSSICM